MSINAEQQITNALANATGWREATDALVVHFIKESFCFSSGEFARWVRVLREDLVFSVRSMGDYIRDLFYSGSMPNYIDSFGNTMYPSQVPRTTTGLGRTPAGVEVFVYCPDPSDGFAHPFEVDIPKPGGAKTQYVTPPPSAGGPQPTPVTKPPVQITGNAKTLVTLKAKVHDDGRLCVPRAAFEMYVHFTQQPMKGGDPVYVRVETDKAVITLGHEAGAKSYDLQTTRGRVLIPRPSDPFVAGDTYNVRVTPDGLTVDFV